MIVRAIKWICFAVLTLILSLVGLSAMRLVLSLIDRMAVWFGYHFAYWHALGSSPLDGPIVGAWFTLFVWMGLISWVTVWCFGSRPIHWFTVLLLTVIVAGLSWLMIGHGALTRWFGVVMVLIPIAFCLLIVAKLFGFNRLGRWLGEKGLWWWREVIVPWMTVPAVGFFAWPLVLLLLWWLLPGFHARLLNDVVPWIVQWVLRPVAEVLIEVIIDLVRLLTRG